MEEAERSKIDAIFIQSMQQVNAVFKQVFTNKNQLNKGIQTILSQIDSPVLIDLFDQFPTLLNQYELSDLLAGTPKIPYCSSLEIQQACLLATIQSLMLGVSQLLDKNTLELEEDHKESVDLQLINYIVKSISLVVVLRDLTQLVRSVVGEKYFKVFVEKLPRKRISTLISNNKGDKQLEVMLWFGLVRIFLEAVYFWRTEYKEKGQV